MRKFLISLVQAILIFGMMAAMVLMFTACEGLDLNMNQPTTTTMTTSTTMKAMPLPVAQRIELYWENTTEPHPERKPWSDKLVNILKADLSKYQSAKDILEICPKFNLLSESYKLKALGEFWVATSYFESSFNPNSNSVDVGSPNDKGSWSVGLYQMSSNDSACKVYGATFEKLKDPLMNIDCALEQMRRQLKNTGEILLPNSSKYRYWAVLLEGNKYSKIADIKSRVMKHANFCK